MRQGWQLEHIIPPREPCRIEFPLDPATKRRVFYDRVVAEATALLAELREARETYRASVACGVAPHRQIREYGADSESK
jgi:hypothetical protein